jgi:outer membrane receptor protein involved in Fe transport
VLIDGLRSTNFPINDDGHNAYVDLNSIPFSLVDRIEVLKDGASSTYGADAIGGVVNIISRSSSPASPAWSKAAWHRSVAMRRSSAPTLTAGLWRLCREGLQRLYQRRISARRPGQQPRAAASRTTPPT